MCSNCSDTREENSQAGIAECDECFHALALHGPHGCTRYRTRQIEGSSETEQGPCGCTAYEVEE